MDSETKYKAIFNKAPDGIVLIDQQTGFIIDCNPEFEKQTGRSINTLREMRIWELRPQEKVKSARKKFLEILEKGEGYSAELEFQKPSGDIVPIEFKSKYAVIDGKGYLLSITRDITRQ